MDQRGVRSDSGGYFALSLLYSPQPAAVRLDVNLQVNEVLDASGTRRLVLEGELDLATAGGLGDRLKELAAAEQPVRIDLSRLEFMDSCGITLFVAALRDARANGWQLEIDTDVGHLIARVLEITGVDATFWPENRPRLAHDGAGDADRNDRAIV